jgi:plastocyanin
MSTPRLWSGLVLCALACGSGSTTPDSTVTSIALGPATLDTMFSVGETVQLSAVARGRSGGSVAGALIALQSSATDVATVTNDGIVTAVGNGAATITASVGSVSASTTVRVRQKLARAVVAPASATVSVGRSLPLSAIGTDSRGNAIGGLPTPAFASSDAQVASVDGAGVVTGRSLGSATITASVNSPADGTRSGTVEIRVVAAPPVAATVQMLATTFSPASVDVAQGGTVTWVNDSGTGHDVDFGSPSMRLPVFETGSRFLTFPTAGSFAYHCNLHAGMTGTVTVR